MSVSRTLDRFLAEVRREVKRNPAFAERLDAVFRAHVSGREVREEVMADVLAAPAPAPSSLLPALPSAASVNPNAIYAKGGEEAVRAALRGLDGEALLALIAEHNLDPAGAAKDEDQAGLIGLIAAAAKKRVERDRKLFDY